MMKVVPSACGAIAFLQIAVSLLVFRINVAQEGDYCSSSANSKCPDFFFCNFEDGSSGFCEECFEEVEECDEAELPQKGKEDCRSKCTGSNDCSNENPCPNNHFCNFDYGSSGFCEDCLDECSDNGLPTKGESDCQSRCNGSNDEPTPPPTPGPTPPPTPGPTPPPTPGPTPPPTPGPTPRTPPRPTPPGPTPPGPTPPPTPGPTPPPTPGPTPPPTPKPTSEQEQEQEEIDLEMIPQPLGECVIKASDGPVPDDIWSTTGIINDNTKYRPFTKYVVTRGIILAAGNEISDTFLAKVKITLNQMIPDDSSKFNRKEQEGMMIAMAMKKTLIPVVQEFDFFDNFNGNQQNQYNSLERSHSVCDVIFELKPNNLKNQPMEVVEHLLHFINMVGLYYERYNEWGISRVSALYEELKISCTKNYFNYEGCNTINQNNNSTDRILLQEYSYWLIATWMDLVVTYGPENVANEWKLYTPSLLREKQMSAYILSETVSDLLAKPKNLEDYKSNNPVMKPTFSPTMKPVLSPTMKPITPPTPVMKPTKPPTPVMKPTFSPTKKPTKPPTGKCDDNLDFFRKKKGKKLGCKWIQKARKNKQKKKRCKAKAGKGKKFWFHCPATCAKVNIGPCA